MVAEASTATRKLISRTQSRLHGFARLPKLCRSGNARPEVGGPVLNLKGHPTAPTAATEKPGKGAERSLLVMSQLSNAVQGVVIPFVPWICVCIGRHGRLQALAGTQTERRAVSERGHGERCFAIFSVSRNPESLFMREGVLIPLLARNMMKLCRGFVLNCRTINTKLSPDGVD